MRRLRVAIDCRITDTRQGVATAVLALATALSESEDVGQEYTFLVPEDIRDWIAPHIFGQCRLKGIPLSKGSRLKDALRSFAPVRIVWERMLSKRMPVPASDGYLESEGFDVVHFPTQSAYLTRVPSIYQPWDLQHLHYPQFFSENEIALREKRYRAYCAQAEYMCVQTEWSRRDVIAQYGLPPEKVVVLRWGSVFDAYTPPTAEQRSAAARKYSLPAQFFVYPAVTWPHKNHEDVLRAIHLLRTKQGKRVQVVFTGAQTDFRRTLDALALKLQVEDQVHFLGFVTEEELQSIFSAAAAMVFPSRFEGFGLPILEAFRTRLPVICSNATVLPEVAQDGALYFAPGRPDELAAAMIRILDDPALRELLKAEGDAVLAAFSIKDMAAGFQRLYARAAGVDGAQACEADHAGATLGGMNEGTAE